MEARFAAQMAELQTAVAELRREICASRQPRDAAEYQGLASCAAAEGRACRQGEARYTAQSTHTTPSRGVRPTVAPTDGAGAFPSAAAPAAAQAVRTGSTWPTDEMRRLRCARDMRDEGLISAAEFDSIKRRLVQALGSPSQPLAPPPPPPTQQASPWQQSPPQPPWQQQQSAPQPIAPWLLSQPPRLLAARVQQLELELSRRPPPSPLLSLSPPHTWRSQHQQAEARPWPM